MSHPLYALLLDVDGPIASPVTRTLAQPTIAQNLVAMARAGVPIIFNTGRSAAFIQETVMPELFAAGLPGEAVVFAICEKGAVWFEMKPNEDVDIHVDDALALRTDVVEKCRHMAAEQFSETMFFDETKLAMASLEQLQTVPSEVYYPAQQRFESRLAEWLHERGIGYEWLDESNSDAPAVRIDRTVISTDVEAAGVGKQVGAEKAVAFLASLGIAPRAWRTLGDSRSDYAMADWLHRNGYDVAHGDVRPADGKPSKPYRIETVDDLVNDEAGAMLLGYWTADVERDTQGMLDME